ncbi:hypothetical protein ABB37_08953 [Leptomonas pyrrhocoris]|uniref:DNA-directed RNA polymerase III subunit RPC3 n=1 Tax=Leptomonas pyrrhocoris TaxID=157538 RepID=A0A0M9FQJ3_LEPPY|nr:hypothetical protein ABB37_09692 [Leptomonas pyrrhocoris]XP_015653436.1 hypothetical protein ABB37_08953 [Leptomonas pyrrhocoris]KPA73816.1 hypothetical protein ABB37_09692 [Leptomonas pyrrhocoris]KPA74997.1 hypothetical protein ABB37_08953 [Leptomonas pyrrhocoris]|eukprot:XP_015652255.1 hypothetical protein ABB37_09692 [Leptomonas pyrrhocoris]
MPLFCVGAAATQPSEICEDLSAKPIAAHDELLVSTVAHQLGPLAGAVCRALTQSGPMTLTDLSETVQRDEDVRGVAAAAANRASATGERTTAVPATHQIGTSLHVDLGELSSASALIHEVALKEVVTRLVLHRLVYADPSTQLYGVRRGTALLLRVFFPLLLHCVRQQYGEAAKCVLLAVYQLGAVPPVSAVQVALSRTPSIGRDALDYAVTQLVADGWLVPVVVAVGDGVPPTRAGSSGDDDLWSPTTPYRVGVESALFFLMNDALEQAVAERYADGGLALTLIRALRRRVAPRAAHGDAGAASWAELAAALPTSAGVRRDRAGRPVEVAENTRSAELVQRCLQQLCQPIVLLSCGAASSMTSTAALSSSSLTFHSTPPATRALVVQSHRQRGLYALDNVTVVHLLQEAACERVVYAGYGVLGVRIMKLLLQHHYLEERTLAEQSVATYARARDVLHRMFKDGLLTQQEVPRSGALAERAAKGSIFLWGLSWSATLLPTVRERLAKSLAVAWVKLREAQQQQQAAVSKDEMRAHVPPSAPSSSTPEESAGHDAVDDAEAKWKYGLTRSVQQALQAQRTVTGLQSCVMSLMRLLLIVDFF